MLKSRSVQWAKLDCHNPSTDAVPVSMTDPTGVRIQRDRKNRLIKRLVLAAAVSAALAISVIPNSNAQAQQAAATTAAAAPSTNLVTDADLFLHYSLLGEEQLANDSGKAFLAANPSPVEALHAFDAAANGRDVSEILIGNQQNKPLKKVSAELSDLLEKGHLAVARNPSRINKAIEVMVNSPRAFVVSRERLNAAGEFAAPFFIQYLNSPSHASYGPTIVQMMSDIGKQLLNPLVRQLATTSTPEKIQIVQVLGNISYPQALPYLAQIATDKNSSPDLKLAAETAIAKIDPTGHFAHQSAAELYLWLAEAYYHGDPSFAVNHPNEATNPVWYYDKGLGDVVGVPVPTPIWKDIETMRACEAVLKLDHHNAAAISLWLAAALRREVDMPTGAKDPTVKSGAPDAHYYAVAAGPRYLNPVLSIALHAENSQLVLKTLQALQQTGGVNGLVYDGHNSPLIQAIAYPDPTIRFEAASALAQANPARPFAGSDEVVPILSEAIAQSTKPVVLLVDSDIQIRNAMKANLRSKYHVIDAATVSQAVTASIGVPYIGMVILPGAKAVSQFQQFATTDYHLRYTPVLVMGSADDLPGLHAQFVNNPTMGVIPTGAPESSIEQSYNDIMSQLGSQPVTSEESTAFALRAANELRHIAMNRASIYNANKSIPALKLALQSADNNVVMAVAATLGEIRNPLAQQLLAHAALNSQSAPENVRYAFYDNLAQSARNIGNHLNKAQIDDLINEVSNETNAKVRSAAAETLGALNVVGNQASKLILSQVR